MSDSIGHQAKSVSQPSLSSESDKPIDRFAVPHGVSPDTVESHDLAALRASKGFLLPIYKPPGKSSSFYIGQIRWRLSRIHKVKRFRVGYAGTLDPFAEGLLVVMGGKATSLQDSLIHMRKSYRAKIRFGASTPSLDPDTEEDFHDPAFRLDPTALTQAAIQNTGEVLQMPPNFSAKMVAGRRAYSIARGGAEPVLSPVRVQIHSIQVISTTDREAVIDVTCGSGCYIRAIARDLAAALGTRGYLTGLVRTEGAGFSLSDCWQFPAIIAALRV